MTKTVDQAIDEIVAEIDKAEAEIRDKKKTVNTLCTVAKRDPLYKLDEPEQVVSTSIRPDQFYGQQLATSVRTILEMRRHLGAATINEIYDALTKGGYQFQTKNDEVARQSLRNSLAKNTTTFHKLPNGRFGMLSWYPNVRQAKSNATTTTVTGDFEPEAAEIDTGAEEGAPVVPE